MICIIDWRVGNTGFIRNMIRKVGHQAEISGVNEVIRKTNALILPGGPCVHYDAYSHAQKLLAVMRKLKRLAGR